MINGNKEFVHYKKCWHLFQESIDSIWKYASDAVSQISWGCCCHCSGYLWVWILCLLCTYMCLYITCNFKCLVVYKNRPCLKLKPCMLIYCLSLLLAELPGWPLLSTPMKIQLQKCDKCSREFCSTINYRRHIRVHHRLKKLDKVSFLSWKDNYIFISMITLSFFYVLTKQLWNLDICYFLVI